MNEETQTNSYKPRYLISESEKTVPQNVLEESNIEKNKEAEVRDLRLEIPKTESNNVEDKPLIIPSKSPHIGLGCFGGVLSGLYTFIGCLLLILSFIIVATIILLNF